MLTCNELFAGLTPACLLLIQEQTAAMLADVNDPALNERYKPTLDAIEQVLFDKTHDLVQQ